MAERWLLARDLMTPKPLTVSPDAPLSKAIGMMREHRIHELPVLRRNRLAGMVTFESIARRPNLALSTKVEHLLLLPPIVTPTTPFPELAEQLLAAGLRAAPVVGRKGELVGVVSRTDLVRALPNFDSIANHRVEEVQEPISLLVSEHEPMGTLLSQIRLLEERPLPVVDRKGRLVGAVGISDLGQVLWRPVGRQGNRGPEQRGSVMDVEVRTLMHSPAITVSKGTTTGAAATLMTRQKVSSVFVVEGDRPVGVVSQASLLGLAVGGGDSGAKAALEDVYVQVTGLRGSADPSILAEVDREVAKGLRRIARHARPQFLSLHVSPHATHRSGEATVEARLHTDRGIYFASRTEWNFYAGVSALMDELESQTRRTREEGKRRGPSSRSVTIDDEPADPDLEAKIRAATGPE